MSADASARPGPVRRLLEGSWRFLDFSRRLVFNLVFLIVLLALLAALAKGPGLQPLKDKTTLVLDLNGALVEQFTEDPVSRALAGATGGEAPGELQLRDLLAALEQAKADPKISQLVLFTDGFVASGMAGARELAAAIDDFRASGKKVLAYGTSFDQMGYFLAARADEIYMDPEGMVLIEGLGRYRLYYRELLADKLGVDVQLFRVGEYKSAAEPYILDAASPEAKEADLHWMGDLWQRYLAEVGAARGLSDGALDALINDLPARLRGSNGDFAALAQQEKLIDGTHTLEEIEDLLAERGATDEETGFRQVGLDGYLAHVRMTHGQKTGDAVAVVVAQGEITDGDQPPGTVGGESTAALLRDARDDEDVKAVVLRVDSPGGGVYPSEQIRREVVALQAAGKPVVVSMGDVAASGGYWISMDADAIYADPSTITGSIGIFGLWMTGPRALERIGARADGVGTTPLAGAFDPTRSLQPQAAELIQTFIDHGYAQFIGKVAKGREMEESAVDAVARGRVWSGAQAKAHGLVDELGGLGDALADAAARAELAEGKWRIHYVEKALPPFQQFLADVGQQARGRAVLGALAPLLGDRAVRHIDAELRFLERIRDKPFQAAAHCFCGL